MKVAFLLCFFCSVVISFSLQEIQHRSLKDDFNELVSLIPEKDILKVVVKYVFRDPEVKQIWKYIFSEDFSKLVMRIDNTPGYKEILNYLKTNGIDVYKFINILHNILGIPPLQSKIRRSDEDLGGLRGLITEIEDLIDFDKILIWSDNKLETSHAFKAFVEYLKSPEVKQVIQSIAADPEIIKIEEYLRNLGIHVDEVKSWLHDNFGWFDCRKS